MYADSANDCGDSQFNKRAVYWLAADIAKKAASVDNSLSKIAKKTADSYNGRAPSKTDIFTEGNEGITICLLYTSPSPRDQRGSRMPSCA